MDLSSYSGAQLRENITFMGVQAGNEMHIVSSLRFVAVSSGVGGECGGAIQRPSDA